MRIRLIGPQTDVDGITATPAAKLVTELAAPSAKDSP